MPSAVAVWTGSPTSWDISLARQALIKGEFVRRHEIGVEDRHQIGQHQMRIGHARFVVVVAAIGVFIAIVVPDIAGLEGGDIAKAAVQRQQVGARVDAEGFDQPDVRVKAAFEGYLEAQSLTGCRASLSQQQIAAGIANQPADVSFFAGDEPGIGITKEGIDQDMRAVFGRDGCRLCFDRLILGRDILVDRAGLRFKVVEERGELQPFSAAERRKLAPAGV